MKKISLSKIRWRIFSLSLSNIHSDLCLSIGFIYRYCLSIFVSILFRFVRYCRYQYRYCLSILFIVICLSILFSDCVYRTYIRIDLDCKGFEPALLFSPERRMQSAQTTRPRMHLCYGNNEKYVDKRSNGFTIGQKVINEL